jgi:hypothetical protein
MFDNLFESMPTALKRRLLVIAAVAAGLSSIAVVSTLTATDLNPLGAGDEQIKLVSNTFVDDSEAVVTRQGFQKASTTASAVGDSGPGTEAAPATFPAVNNAITEGNWTYRFTVEESLDGDWPTSRQYLVEVYGDTAGSTSLLTTLYWQNTSDSAGVEGVQATVDLGSATIVPDAFSIIVQRVVN